MNTAATAPPIRVMISGPIPIPSRWSRVAGMVMLFHSPMSRMNRTLPDVVDGDSEPKTASWRIHHGAMTRRNTATAPTPAANGMVGRLAPAERHARQRSNRKTTPSETSDEQAVVPGERRETGEQAGQDERAPGMRRPAKGTRRHPQRGDDQRLVEREVVGLRHVDGGQQRDRHEHARPDRHERSARPRPGRWPRSAARRSRRSARTGAPTPRRRHRRSPGTGPGRSTPAASSGRWTGSAGSGPPGSCRRPRGRSR